MTYIVFSFLDKALYFVGFSVSSHGFHEHTSDCGQVVAQNRQGTSVATAWAGVLVVRLVRFGQEYLGRGIGATLARGWRFLGCPWGDCC